MRPFAGAAETHSAAVYFAGDRAYKLKKPVNLGFLDFSTPQARAAACAREAQLNRRFAPDVYLGVAEVADPDGRTCDHLVVMRRMPAERRLATLVRARAPVSGHLRQVARLLAAAHAAAPRGAQIDTAGGRDALWRRWQDNLDQVRAAAHRLDAATIAQTRHLAGRFLAGRGPLFDARVREGRIVDGHGDLLAEDIFCLDDGPRLLDCLDFDDRLRWLDGLDDAAFLAMDLERLGAAELAQQFIAWYAEYSADPAPSALCHHYIAYRAFVRAKVACLRWDQGDDAGGTEAGRLAELTLAHLRAGAVTLVLVGGQPGSGKSALAGELASALGWTVLSSDLIRKELAGLPPGRPSRAAYQAGIYSPAWTERTYAELLRRAARLLSFGEPVIADASWTSAAHRAAAAATAELADADLVPLRCTAPADVTGRRLRTRGDGPSDADETVARRLAAAAQPWPEATAVDTSGGAPAGPGGALAQALTALGRGPGAAPPAGR